MGLKLEMKLKMLPFCFSPISIMSCLRTKDTRLCLHIHIRVLGEPGNEAKCITDLTLFCRGTFQLELFWHLCVSTSANDTITASLYLLHKPTIQHVAAQTPSVPKHSEDQLKKHEKLEYMFARLKVSVRFQLESASINKESQRNFFLSKQGALLIRTSTVGF